MMDKIIKNKEKDCANDKDLYDNFKSIKNKNEELESKININENKINLLQDELNKLKENEDIIKSMNQFKCKNCNQIFNDEQEFLQHYNSCQYNNITNYKNENENINKLKNKNKHNSFNSSILNNINFDPEKLGIKVIKAKVKNDELGKPYIEYLISVKYGDKNWQIRKKFYHFANLFNTLNNKYQDFVPINLSNIFDDLNSNASFNLNKIKQLDKFLNEIASADVINSSKPFLKFIEFEKNVNKKDSQNKNNKYTDKNILPYKHIKNKSYNKKYDKNNNNNNDYFRDKFKFDNNNNDYDIITNDNNDNYNIDEDENNYNYHKNNIDDDNYMTLPEKRSNHRYTYTIISPKNNKNNNVHNEHYVENEYYFKNNNNKYNDYYNYNNNYRGEDEIIKSSHSHIYDNYNCNDYYI